MTAQGITYVTVCELRLILAGTTRETTHELTGLTRCMAALDELGSDILNIIGWKLPAKDHLRLGMALGYKGGKPIRLKAKSRVTRLRPLKKRILPLTPQGSKTQLLENDLRPAPPGPSTTTPRRVRKLTRRRLEY